LLYECVLSISLLRHLVRTREVFMQTVKANQAIKSRPAVRKFVSALENSTEHEPEEIDESNHL